MATELASDSGRLRLERRLGQGAVGEVFLGVVDGQRVVLKFAREPATFGRLVDEGSRLLGVDSDFCVRLLGAGRLVKESPGARLVAGTPYLMLEHRSGTALDPRLALTEVARRERALVVARDVGRALLDLHTAGVAHGDVKPENILLESGAHGERASLMDFGLAGAAEESVAQGGTVRYLAPEVRDAPGSGDARLRDLYALGATLAEILSPTAVEAARPGEAPLTIADPELARLVRGLLASAPAARPSADWVVRTAFALLGEIETDAERRARRVGGVRRAYLALRRAELRAAAGSERVQRDLAEPVHGWVSQALELARSVEALRAPSPPERRPEAVISELGSVGRGRWLVSIVGSAAAAWPELGVATDGELATRLIAAVERVEPSCLSYSDLEARGNAGAASDLEDPIELALALGRGAPSQATLEAADRLLRAHEGPPALGIALGRAFRLRGQLARALSVLSRVDRSMARVEEAEVLRRAGDRDGARALLATLEQAGIDRDVQAKARAVRARLLLDAGEPRAALELASSAPESAFSLEIAALAQFALGARDEASRSLARARLLAESDEERARIVATEGNLAHYEGQSELALSCARRAAEHAACAGAVLEEASYLTSVAAAATQVGELHAAALAGRRALLLFESIGRAREAARALLSLAAVHAASGASLEARELGRAALSRARASGDVRCRAYAHLVLADVAEESDPEAVEHARFAASLVGEGDPDDGLRVAARLHVRGDAMPLEPLDRAASSEERALDARLDWWTARAKVAALEATPLLPRGVLDALLGLGEANAPSALRGPAFTAGASLAAHIGDGDAARRLTQLAAEAARELIGRAGPELAGQLRSLAWVRASDAALSVIYAPEQLMDVDRLVRALGRRDRLRPLLEQVVDALVLWTGVERGLLLLRAPGAKLKPRAARNLSRADLRGAQLELSSSLAERALSLGEPVVAVDATGDLPTVHESVHALKLRSVLAVPLIARGEALGVVYLDDRVRRGAFGPRELSWVRLVATLAAIAIADARDQILLRRTAERARRAEARLARVLARREAELDVAERELARTRDARETRFKYGAIIGQSEAMRSMLRIVDRVVSSDVPVLLIGESGCGKELVARAIHENGSRQARPFVTENCGAIPETLLESTLFGHVRGAFTGAVRPRAGLFEVANTGTLLLDEIGEMSLAMQAKLLRVLQDGELHPLGAERARRVDVRVIGATHRDLAALVASGRFREDLYYRLNVITVKIPSLRERIGDVALLVKHFVARYAGERKVQISKSALDRLAAYAWPGNVRQLENEVRRALVLSDELITPEHLSPELVSPAGKVVEELNLKKRVDTLESELVRLALRRTDGNQTRAAELLGVSRFGLQKMIKRLEILM